MGAIAAAIVSHVASAVVEYAFFGHAGYVGGEDETGATTETIYKDAAEADVGERTDE